MSELRWSLNTVSGAVARVPGHFFDHPIFGEYLVEVEPHTKSYDPQLWKPTTASEYEASRKPKPKTPPVDPTPERKE